MAARRDVLNEEDLRALQATYESAGLPARTDEAIQRQFREAQIRGARAARTEPRAARARYDHETGRIVIDLTNGCQFAFPTEIAQGLRGADPDLLAEVEVFPTGSGLHWEKLDADLGVVELLSGIFGSKVWMRESGRRGGAVKSAAKARAARENGKLGGRPRKATRPNS